MTIFVTRNSKRSPSCPTLEEMRRKQVAAIAESDPWSALPDKAGNTVLRTATVLQAAKLLGTDKAHVEAVLRRQFHEFSGGQYRYDIRLLYALKQGTDVTSVGRSDLAEAKRCLKALTAKKVPAPTFEGESVPYEYVENMFGDPPLIPKFATEDDAARWVRVKAYEEISAASAEAVRKGFTCEVFAMRRAPKSLYGRGKPCDYGVKLSMTVGPLPTGGDVGQRRQEILDGLLGCRDDLFPTLEFAQIYPSEVSASESGGFEEELERRYERDPEIRVWYQKQLKGIRGKSLVFDLLSRADLLPYGYWTRDDEIALRAYMVLFADPGDVVQAIKARIRPEDPHGKLPKILCVNDEAWDAWTAGDAPIICRRGFWIRKFSIEEAVTIFEYKMVRYDRPGQMMLWRAQTAGGKWMRREPVKQIEANIREAGIDVETGRLMLDGRSVKPAFLFSPAGKGVVTELPEFATACDWPERLRFGISPSDGRRRGR